MLLGNKDQLCGTFRKGIDRAIPRNVITKAVEAIMDVRVFRTMGAQYL